MFQTQECTFKITEESEAAVHGRAPSDDSFRGNMKRRAERGVW